MEVHANELDLQLPALPDLHVFEFLNSADATSPVYQERLVALQSFLSVIGDEAASNTFVFRETLVQAFFGLTRGALSSDLGVVVSDDGETFASDASRTDEDGDDKCNASRASRVSDDTLDSAALLVADVQTVNETAATDAEAVCREEEKVMIYFEGDQRDTVIMRGKAMLPRWEVLAALCCLLVGVVLACFQRALFYLSLPPGGEWRGLPVMDFKLGLTQLVRHGAKLLRIQTTS